MSVVADTVQFLDSPNDRPADRAQDAPSGDGAEDSDGEEARDDRELLGAGVGTEDGLAF